MDLRGLENDALPSTLISPKILLSHFNLEQRTRTFMNKLIIIKAKGDPFIEANC